MSESQVAIIGAGFAGLAAARRLSEFGIGVELFEATGRVGGRAHTLHDATSGVPVELGPEFMHGRPEVTLAILRAAGFEVEDIAERHHLVQNGSLDPAPDMWERFAALLEHTKHMRNDRSARAYMERSKMAPDDAALFAMLVQGFYAAPLDDISVFGIASDASAGEGNAQTRPRGGYGALIDFLAKELRRSCVPINHSCEVHEIDWGGDRVEIDYRRGGQKGSAASERVIVTAPLGVLKSGTLRFRPALGSEVELALGQLGMGQVVKLVLCMKEPVWKSAARGLEFVHHVDACDACFPTFWVHGDHQLTAWAGGPHARALAGKSKEELVGHAVDDVARALGMPREPIADAIVHAHFHDYAADPYARGAYSYTRVGGSDAAAVLSRPLGNRVFLAGEATDRDYEGSVAGAIASGIRAAEQVLRAMHVVRGPLIIGAPTYRR